MVPPLLSPGSTKAVSDVQYELSPHVEGTGSSFRSFLGSISSMIGIPVGFFQSRGEIRTWGEETLTDPSVQPQSETAPSNLGTCLPGYPKSACAYFNPTFGSTRVAPEFVNLFTLLDVHDNKLWVPKLVPFPKCAVKYPTLPLGQFATPTYDYRDLLSYRMDYHPYVNAEMNSQDPAPMYVCANWMVGYPYGVPAVEENERAEKAAASSTGHC